jgi:hypothetical protein
MHNSHNRPWMHRELFSTVQRLTRFFGSITFSHMSYRESNSLADCMAKQGVRRSNDFIAWFWSISQLMSIRLLKVLHFRGSASLERWIGDSWKFPLDFVVVVILCRFQCCFLRLYLMFCRFVWTLLRFGSSCKIDMMQALNFSCRQVMAFNEIIYF